MGAIDDLIKILMLIAGIMEGDARAQAKRMIEEQVITYVGDTKDGYPIHHHTYFD